MPLLTLRQPRLPNHYFTWCEPPDEAGDEALHFVSGRRAIKLKGRSFREFMATVVPLLDGKHTIEAIEQTAAPVFRPEDLAECLALLASQNLLQEGDDGMSAATAERFAPQLNFFHEVQMPAREAQAALAQATVVVMGLGGAGAGTARAMAAAGVGCVRCIDALPVQSADVYLTQFFRPEHINQTRAQVVAGTLQELHPEGKFEAFERPIESEQEVRDAISGADFVVCGLDPSQTNLVLKLNRVCLALNIRWTSARLGGTEVTVGPTVIPHDGPCYLCYRMRTVACAMDPEAAFELEQRLDRRKADDSARRENLTFGAGLAANLLALEAFKAVTKLPTPGRSGRITTISLLDFSMTHHTVLRKPWCPVCFEDHSPAPTPAPTTGP